MSDTHQRTKGQGPGIGYPRRVAIAATRRAGNLKDPESLAP